MVNRKNGALTCAIAQFEPSFVNGSAVHADEIGARTSLSRCAWLRGGPISLTPSGVSSMNTPLVSKWP